MAKLFSSICAVLKNSHELSAFESKPDETRYLLQNVRASELMLQRMDELVEQRATFSFETTLAARSYHRRVPQWQELGYRVHLFFLWLPSSDMALLRVANRVKQGGYDIPVATIRKRYAGGLKNFETLYRSVVDHWYCFDGSMLPPELIVQSSGDSVEIVDSDRWETFSQSLGGTKHPIQAAFAPSRDWLLALSCEVPIATNCEKPGRVSPNGCSGFR